MRAAPPPPISSTLNPFLPPPIFPGSLTVPPVPGPPVLSKRCNNAPHSLVPTLAPSKSRLISKEPTDSISNSLSSTAPTPTLRRLSNYNSKPTSAKTPAEHADGTKVSESVSQSFGDIDMRQPPKQPSETSQLSSAIKKNPLAPSFASLAQPPVSKANLDVNKVTDSNNQLPEVTKPPEPKKPKKNPLMPTFS